MTSRLHSPRAPWIRWLVAIIILTVIAAAVWTWRAPDPARVVPIEPDATYMRSPDLRIFSLHPSCDDASFPYIADAIRALNERLRNVELAARDRGMDVDHAFQGGCGSGFLRQNIVGNDLDYNLVIHLGELDARSADNTATADALLDRMESYLHLFRDVVRKEEGPDLALYEFPHMNGPRLRNRNRVRKEAATSIASVRKQQAQFLIYETPDGRHVPAILSENEIPLYVDVRANFLSNRIRYAPEMYPGIREFGIVIRFMIDLRTVGDGGKEVLIPGVDIVPIHRYSGRLLSLHTVFLGIAPVGQNAADHFKKTILSDLDRWADYRVLSGSGLLGEVERQLQTHRPLKSLKRLHQAYDFLAPLFDDQFGAELDIFLRAHLQDPDVLLSEGIRELAMQLELVFENPRLCRLFTNSGDLQRTLRWIYVNLVRLQDRAPGPVADDVAGHRDRLATALRRHGPPYRPWERCAYERIMDAIADEAREWTAALLDDAIPPMLAHRDHIRNRLAVVGIHPVRVYGLSADGPFGVLDEDLDGLATVAELNRLGHEGSIPPYQYRQIDPADIPPNRNGETTYFPSTLWLSLPQDDNQRAVNESSLSRLAEDLKQISAR